MRGKGLGTFFPDPEAEQQIPAERALRALPDAADSEADSCLQASKQEVPSEVRPEVASDSVSLQASKHAVIQASDIGTEAVDESESKLASLQALAQDEHQNAESGATAADPLGELWPVLAEPATITNAFRFANGELERLGDVVYQISKQHAVKIPKQDVVRLALGAVLLDYERDGEESLLGRYVRRRKQWRRGGE